MNNIAYFYHSDLDAMVLMNLDTQETAAVEPWEIPALDGDMPIGKVALSAGGRWYYHGDRVSDLGGVESRGTGDVYFIPWTVPGVEPNMQWVANVPLPQDDPDNKSMVAICALTDGSVLIRSGYPFVARVRRNTDVEFYLFPEDHEYGGVSTPPGVVYGGASSGSLTPTGELALITCTDGTDGDINAFATQFFTPSNMYQTVTNTPFIRTSYDWVTNGAVRAAVAAAVTPVAEDAFAIYYSERDYSSAVVSHNSAAVGATPGSVYGLFYDGFSDELWQGVVQYWRISGDPPYLDFSIEDQQQIVLPRWDYDPVVLFRGVWSPPAAYVPPAFWTDFVGTFEVVSAPEPPSPPDRVDSYGPFTLHMTAGASGSTVGFHMWAGYGSLVPTDVQLGETSGIIGEISITQWGVMNIAVHFSGDIVLDAVVTLDVPGVGEFTSTGIGNLDPEWQTLNTQISGFPVGVIEPSGDYTLEFSIQITRAG